MAHRRCCCCLLINLLLINLYISWIKHVNKHLRSPIVYTRLLLLLLLFVLFSHLVCSFLYNVFYNVYNVFSTCRTSKCLTSPIVCGPKLWGPVGPWRDQWTIALHSCLHSQYIHKRRKIGLSSDWSIEKMKASDWLKKKGDFK